MSVIKSEEFQKHCTTIFVCTYDTANSKADGSTFKLIKDIFSKIIVQQSFVQTYDLKQQTSYLSIIFITYLSLASVLILPDIPFQTSTVFNIVCIVIYTIPFIILSIMHIIFSIAKICDAKKNLAKLEIAIEYMRDLANPKRSDLSKKGSLTAQSLVKLAEIAQRSNRYKRIHSVITIVLTTLAIIAIIGLITSVSLFLAGSGTAIVSGAFSITNIIAITSESILLFTLITMMIQFIAKAAKEKSLKNQIKIQIEDMNKSL